MSETGKPKPLEPNSDEYNLVYTHLERVLEQPIGAAKGNHAALNGLEATWLWGLGQGGSHQFGEISGGFS